MDAKGYQLPVAGLSSVRFSGRLKQVVTRVLRSAEAKQPLVIDYVDGNVGILAHQAKEGQRIYATM